MRATFVPPGSLSYSVNSPAYGLALPAPCHRPPLLLFLRASGKGKSHCRDKGAGRVRVCVFCSVAIWSTWLIPVILGDQLPS